VILDVSIILAYFTAIMAIGVRARVRKDVRTEEYFLSARSLKWPAIAMSTVATNIQANHFIGMAGSASPDGQESPPMRLSRAGYDGPDERRNTASCHHYPHRLYLGAAQAGFAVTKSRSMCVRLEIGIREAPGICGSGVCCDAGAGREKS